MRSARCRCPFMSAHEDLLEGHLEVVKALLEAGGRELLMLTKGNGVSCLMVSLQNGHLEVVKALLEVGGRELLMLTMDNGASCLSLVTATGYRYPAREAIQGEVCRVLEMACQNAGLSSHEITILKLG
jgi:ankyrin repeat protein